MICVTIGRGRHRTLLEEWKEAAEAGAELVELRIDCLRSEIDLKRILEKRLTPIVFTLRRTIDGGLFRGTEDKRRMIIREAIVAGVDYIDVEVDIAHSIPRYGKTKRIISYHNFQETPDNLEEIVGEALRADPDVIKVATLARSVGDASRVLEVSQRASTKTPTIGIAMGPLGVFTRVVNRKYGAPFTYAGFNPERTFAPGMLSFSELRDDYGYDRINAETELYGVIGDPIAQSLSPTVHNACFIKQKLNKIYVPLLIPKEKLKQSLDAIMWMDWKGLSVTIPHKEEAVRLLKLADGAVERVRACNTLISEKNSWTGYNTDYHAALDVLEDALGGRAHDDLSPLIDKHVVIIGAGGVARSIAAGLVQRGSAVTLMNRHEDRAAEVAADVGCRHGSWAQRAGTPCDILINATPVGMYPHLDDTPVPPAAFRPGMLVFDTVYHPENTMFLKLARERDCKTASGVDMFVSQAALQYKHFTGNDADEELMRSVVKRKLSVAKT